MKNILVINLKGGAAKTTNASLIASFLPFQTDQNILIEVDKINQSDSRIKSKDYKSIQLDFLNESDSQFLEFENLLLDDGLKIIDVGAVVDVGRCGKLVAPVDGAPHDRHFPAVAAREHRRIEIDGEALIGPHHPVNRIIDGAIVDE